MDAALQVSTDRLIARLRDKLAELTVQNALLEAALEEAGIRQAETASELEVCKANLAALEEAGTGVPNEQA